MREYLTATAISVILIRRKIVFSVIFWNRVMNSAFNKMNTMKNIRNNIHLLISFENRQP